MKRFGLLLAVAALLIIVGLGCSSKKSDKSSASGGYLTLVSYASPAGTIRENNQLPMNVTLSCNRAGALIYYTSGATPADPTVTSSIYASTPLTIDAGYADGTYIVKYFAWYKDPDTGNFEQENPFNTSTYKFREDIRPPSIAISPSPGAYADPAAITIELKATDTHDTPAQITIKYTTDGTDPRTSGTATTGTGDGTVVPWTGGKLTIKAVAVDMADNESSVLTATYTVDMAGAAQEVMNLINADRAAASPSLDPLNWNAAWAGACTEHSTGLEAAGNDEHQPSDLDDQNRQLLDFDGDPGTGYVIAATAFAFGTSATGPTDFYNKIKSVPALWAELMKASCTEFGCGFNDDTWEMMCSYNP
jgi:uncharacterized protein YkwD